MNPLLALFWFSAMLVLGFFFPHLFFFLAHGTISVPKVKVDIKRKEEDRGFGADCILVD